MKFRVCCFAVYVALASSGCNHKASSKENSYSSGAPVSSRAAGEAKHGSDANPKDEAQGPGMNFNKSRTPTQTGADQ